MNRGFTGFQCLSIINAACLYHFQDAAATLEPLLMDFEAATEDTLWKITNTSGSLTHTKVNARLLKPDVSSSTEPVCF